MYEIARETGISSKELLDRLHALGIEAGSHMSVLDPKDVERLEQTLADQRRMAKQQAPSTVLRRRKRRTAAPRPAQPVSGQRDPQPRAAGPVHEQAQQHPPRAREEAPLRPAPQQDPPRPQAPQAQGKRKQRRAQDRPRGERERFQWATLSPRERFERELEEARRRTEERRRAEEEAQVRQPVNAQARAAGRPAVGDIIPLPGRTIIQVRERPRPDQGADRAMRGRPTTAVAPGRGPARSPARSPGRGPAGSPGSTPYRGQPRGADRGPGRAQPRGPARGPFRGQPWSPARPGAPGRAPSGRKPQITTPAEHKRVVKIHDTVTVTELARSMGVKASELLKKLWSMGMMGANINASIDTDAAGAVASEFGYEVKNVAFHEGAALDVTPDEPGALVSRAPVVTVMGHVDHGKTTLLDAIRTARVAAGEAGGITQHIAAYRVRTPSMGALVFLDTPGHEAFTAMRARGAQVTDIVVLVVAANDGVMPQTIEALRHARDARVPVVVAVNKIDAANAQPDRVRQQLADHGHIPEEWGGDTLFVDVSALQQRGIDDLLGAIALQAELLDLKANPDKSAVGVVIEARLDRARGPVATVLVQQGTLRVGDTIVAGEHSGKVRAMLDDQGVSVDAAGPSIPVTVLGLDGVPDAGEAVHATDEKTARQLVDHRLQEKRKRQLASLGKVSLESILDRLQGDEPLELKIVLKTDVQGSAEALEQALARLTTSKVRVNVIHAGVGGVTESDVNLAKAGGAIIVGFNVRPAGKASAVARREGVEIRLYDVIYEALDDVRAAMAGLLPPVRREHALGKAEIRQVFRIPRVGTVAGCMVTEGTVRRSARARVFRDAVQVHEGVIGALKRFQDDVSEVQQGYECGLRLEGTNDLREGDVIEAYEMVEEAQAL